MFWHTVSLPGIQLPSRFAAGLCLLLHKPQVSPETVTQCLSCQVTVTAGSAAALHPCQLSWDRVSRHSLCIWNGSWGAQSRCLSSQHRAARVWGWPRAPAGTAPLPALGQAEQVSLRPRPRLRALQQGQAGPCCEGGRVRPTAVAGTHSPSPSGVVQQGPEASSGGDIAQHGQHQNWVWNLSTVKCDGSFVIVIFTGIKISPWFSKGG